MAYTQGSQEDGTQAQSLDGERGRRSLKNQEYSLAVEERNVSQLSNAPRKHNWLPPSIQYRAPNPQNRAIHMSPESTYNKWLDLETPDVSRFDSSCQADNQY